MMRRMLYGLAIVSVVAITIVCLFALRRKESASPPVAKALSIAEAKGNAVPESVSRTNDLSNAKMTSRFGPYAGLPAALLWKMKPKMYYVAGYPPKTEEGVRMWQWRLAMEKADPGYERKMPIEVYGRIVDQTNGPVAEAWINIEWLCLDGLGGVDKKSFQSDTNGLFNITGIRGKNMTVSVSKKGYKSIPRFSRNDFEYCDFFNICFHIPDPAKPVEFRLWKFINPEPMYVWDINEHMKVDGTMTWIDIKTGKVGTSGDIGFSVVRGKTPGYQPQDYSVTIQVSEGGGIAVSQGEDLMFEAPADGYKPSITIEQKSAPNYQYSQHLRFYLKTATGKYAAVKAMVEQFNGPSAGLEVTIYFNPSGSRNLEYDSEKRITQGN